MQDKRLYTRFDCNRQCHLRWNGEAYPATIQNVSAMSIGLNFEGPRPDVKIGDDCVISLVDDAKTPPYELHYQIVRIDRSGIALGYLVKQLVERLANKTAQDPPYPLSAEW